jgi:hypothetical protein
MRITATREYHKSLLHPCGQAFLISGRSAVGSGKRSRSTRSENSRSLRVIYIALHPLLIFFPHPYPPLNLLCLVDLVHSLPQMRPRTTTGNAPIRSAGQRQSTARTTSTTTPILPGPRQASSAPSGSTTLITGATRSRYDCRVQLLSVHLQSQLFVALMLRPPLHLQSRVFSRH